jgi:hypothetical protein
VTTRDPPLLSERDGTNRPVIWVKRETEYFLPEVWTAQIRLKSLQNSLFTRNGFRAVVGSRQPEPAPAAQ